jgi:hypothetical protein
MSEHQAVTDEDCIFIRNLYSWQTLDLDSLVVWTSGERDAYLVELLRPSPDLPFSIDLQIVDGNADSMLCSYGGDSIVTRGATTEQIGIRSIRRIGEAELEDLLAEHESSRGKRKRK